MTNLLLVEIYKQSHEHLKETGKKRDQLMAFYAALVALLFNTRDKLKDFEGAAFLCIVIGGVFVALAVIHYRKWHLLYLNTVVVLQHLATISESYTAKDVHDAWEKLVRPRPWYRFLNPWFGVEASVFHAFLLLAALPFHVLIWTNGFGFPTPPARHIPSLLVNVGLYLGLMNAVAWVILRAADTRGPRAMWPFRALDWTGVPDLGDGDELPK